MRRPTTAQARARIAARLEQRRSEIEQAIFTRVQGIADGSEVADLDEIRDLRKAVTIALDYYLSALSAGEDRKLLVPVTLLRQARAVARRGSSLDMLLRRYFAGYAVLGDFIVQEADRSNLLDGDALRRLMRAQAIVFDQLLRSLSAEYSNEAAERPATLQQRLADRVRRLLAGELVDTADFAYDFEAHHIGVIAQGADAQRALEEAAEALDQRLLIVPRGDRTVWAWLGRRHRTDPNTIEDRLAPVSHAHLRVTLGELAHGISGWRLTHRQAKAALLVARQRACSFLRYREVALLASILQDDLLSASLRRMYLEPLERDRDGGEVARQTLRAYFEADRHVSSAAAALGVNRNTVASRLRGIEACLGRTLTSCAAELEAALLLDQVEDSPRRPASRAPTTTVHFAESTDP